MTASSGLSTAQIARRSVRGSFFRLVAQYGMAGLGLIKVAILARLIDSSIYGAVAIAAVYVSVLSIFRMELRAIVLNAPPDQPEYLTIQYLIELGTNAAGLLLAGVVYLLQPAICSANCWQAIFLLLIIGPFGVLQAALSTPLYLMERDLQHEVMSRLSLVGAMAGMLSAVGLALIGQPLLALIVDAGMLALIPGIGAWLMTGWRPVWRWDATSAKRIFSTGTTLWTTGLLGIITFQFDDWLVGRFRGESALGFYGEAYARAKIPLDVFGGMVAALSMPLYVQSYAAGPEVLARAYRLTTWLLARLIALSSIVMLAATEEIVMLWMSEKWLPVVPLIRLMFFFILGRPLFQNHGILMVALRRERAFRRIVLVQALILLVAGPVAVLRWGAEGVSAVVSVMMLVGLIIAEVYVARLTGVSALRIYALPVALSIVLPPLLYFAGLALHWPLLISLLLKAVVAALVAAGTTLLFERHQLLEVWALLHEHLLSGMISRSPDSQPVYDSGNRDDL